jgi:archaellin
MVNMGSLKNKKAMMGVSTLIIFITAILVSAVAASVIVRTVGILQERAFTVGTEVRNRLVTVLDFISVTSYNNLTLEQAYGLNVLVRTRAGSYAYDLATMGLIFTSDQGSLTARLQHTENEDFGFVLPDINNETYVSIPDMDEDKLSEKVRLVSDGGVGLDQIEFEFSRLGELAYADLGVDISTATPAGEIVLSNNDTPIVGTTGRWYGFIQVEGNATHPTTLGSPNATINVTHYPKRNFCSFEFLIPEDAFCYDVQLGNTDTAVSRGEIYRLYL